MNSKKKQRLRELIANLIDDEKLSKPDSEELNQLLKGDPEARSFYTNQMELHARLHFEYKADALPESMPDSVPVARQSSLLKAAIIPFAALLAITVIYLLSAPSDQLIATLVSSEDAAWESHLPTAPGASLTKGSLHLKNGLATILFTSGVEMVVEAPAQLELQTAMKARLLTGSATFEVPEPARGFILETPTGYAVDHGTAFSVRVGESTSFEVLEGEISVHSNNSSESVTLLTKESANLQNGVIEKRSTLPEQTAAKQPEGIVRISSNGRAISIIRNNQFEHIHPDFLMTKVENQGDVYARRALVGFDLTKTPIAKARSARLRLNLVPSGMGYASHLQKENRFAVYGVIDESAENWEFGCRWENSPYLNQSILLGTFDIARSQQTGSFGISNEALLQFLKDDKNRKVSLVIIRETPELKKQGLVHAFASDSHPEASGPSLELSF